MVNKQQMLNIFSLTMKGSQKMQHQVRFFALCHIATLPHCHIAVSLFTHIGRRQSWIWLTIWFFSFDLNWSRKTSASQPSFVQESHQPGGSYTQLAIWKYYLSWYIFVKYFLSLFMYLCICNLHLNLINTNCETDLAEECWFLLAATPVQRIHCNQICLYL